MRNRYTGYGIILTILLAILFGLLYGKAIDKRNLERKETLMSMMISIGKHYVSEQQRLQVENPGFPEILNKENSWVTLKPLVSPYREVYPEQTEMIEGEEQSIFSYMSNGPNIGPPGTCFVLEVLLEGDREKVTVPLGFEKAGCVHDNNKLCYFRSGIYKSPDNERYYYRIVGGGC